MIIFEQGGASLNHHSEIGRSGRQFDAGIRHGVDSGRVGIVGYIRDECCFRQSKREKAVRLSERVRESGRGWVRRQQFGE